MVINGRIVKEVMKTDHRLKLKSRLKMVAKLDNELVKSSSI